MGKIRLGILGVSWWTDMVWPGFTQAANAEVTWIAARTGEKAERYAREHGIGHWTDSYAELIAAEDVDAVFVAVPNFLHDEMARLALANGKHVLQEKPMALTSDAAQAQANEAARRGLVLMMDQEYRLANGVRELPATIRARLGTLRKVIIGLTLTGRSWGGWRADPSLTGGALFEMAIHQLEQARWLWGRNPVAVMGMGKDEAGHDFTLIYDYGQGDQAVIDYCWRSIGFRQRIECYADKGYVIQDIEMPVGDGEQTLVTEAGAERTRFGAAVQGADTFRRVLEGFASAILEGAPVPVPAEDGVWAVRMAEAGREALRTGQRVTIGGISKDRPGRGAAS